MTEKRGDFSLALAYRQRNFPLSTQKRLSDKIFEITESGRKVNALRIIRQKNRAIHFLAAHIACLFFLFAV